MTREVLIKTERISRRPCYYTIKENQLYSSDSLLNLFKEVALQPEINFRALSQYIQFGYIQPEETIFKGISELPSGYELSREDNNFVLSKYCDLTFEPDEGKNKQRWCVEIIEQLEQAVKNCLEGTSKPVVFLSGGLDSSLILAMTKRVLREKINTISVGFDCPNKGYNELNFAKEVADYFDTGHYEIVVRPRDIQKLPQLVWEMETPFGNPTSLLTYILAERTKEISDFALAGVGGDENFGGYYKFLGVELMRFYNKVPFKIKKAISSLTSSFSESTDGNHLRRRFRAFVNAADLDAYQRYINWLSYFKPEQVKKLFTEDILSQMDGYSPDIAFLKFLKNENIYDFLNRAYYTEIKTNVPYNQIRYFERTSRRCGLDIRYPFCDDQLIDFAGSIPPRMKIRYFKTKYLLRKAAGKMLPERVLKKRKIGFNAPVGMWFKNGLRPLVSRILSKENIDKRGIFNYEYVREVLELHNSGKIDFSIPIWILINFEVWAKLFLDMKIKEKPQITLDELFN